MKESTDGKAHAVLGASSSKRWIECPGSIHLSKKAPKGKASSFAMEGTAAHELGERGLKSNTNAADYAGSTIGGFKVDEEMIDAVQMYLDVVREDLSPNKTLMIEKRFNLSWLYPGMFGTNDACIAEDFGVLRVYDYKHGAGIAVDVVSNTQLLYYAIGAAFDHSVKAFHDYLEIEMIIVQPRAIHSEGPIRRWTISLTELKKWAVFLREAAIKTKDLNAPLHVGEHCRFCPALPICPKQYEEAQALAKNDFSNELPSPSTLSVEEIAKVIEAESRLKAFIESCKSYAKDAMLKGDMIPGLKLVRGRGSRVWFNEEETIKVAEDFKLKEDDIYTPRLLKSPAQLEKKLGKLAVKELIVKREGGILIAPQNDNRKEVVINAALDFKEDINE